MVSRAWGTANGQEVIFTRVEGDRWEVTVPWTDDGEYIVEIYAEDEAGNRAYACTLLFVISGHELRAHVVPRGYLAEVKGGGYTVERCICGRDDI